MQSGSIPYTYVVFAAVAAALLFVRISQRVGSPVLSIVDRWLRWFGFALGSALICKDLDLIDRPFWALAAAFFLFWFLGETLYNWLAISAISVSPLPLFPRYALNRSGEEWPVQPRLLKLRGWLRSQGFRQAQALKAEIGGGIHLRVSIYEDPLRTVRVQVTFLPQANGSLGVCHSLTTPTADGSRIVTDNLYIPFGGFYPENWLVERLPWTRSLRRLLGRHRARVAAWGSPAVPFGAEALADLVAANQELDRLNTELGFLHPQNERDDLGKITQAGRYRVWKEIWMLNYLGRSARYR